jgi:hypothetical protein
MKYDDAIKKVLLLHASSLELDADALDRRIDLEAERVNQIRQQAEALRAFAEQVDA